MQPCMVMAEEPEQVSEAGLNIKEMTTGVGAEADAIFEDENLPILQFTAKSEAGDESSDWISAVKIRRMQRELFILQRKKMPV